MNLKQILACILVLLILPMHALAAEEETPPPVAVEVTHHAEGTNVSWVPPALTPDQLLGASFKVYGYINGTPYHIGTVSGVIASAQVDGGYEDYGVSVVVNGHESIIVKACVKVDSEFPFVHVTCRG